MLLFWIFYNKKAATSYDGITLKYRVVYIENAVAGVDEQDIKDKKKYLTDNGAIMVDSKQVKIKIRIKNSTFQL